MAKCGARSLLAMVLALWRTQVALCACVQDGPCKCTSDQGTIDLNPIQGNPPFKDQADPTGQWLFSYSPCRPFTEGNEECTNVAVCQVSSDQSQTFPAGTADSALFVTDPSSGSTTITYSSTSQGTLRTTIVTLQCDPSGGPDTLQVFGEGLPATYTMTLTSAHCCFSSGGDGGGLSVGSILCIVLVVVVLAYIAVGIAVQKGVRKASGREVFPNYNLWSSLPSLVKEGAVFTFSRCRGSGAYEKM